MEWLDSIWFLVGLGGIGLIIIGLWDYLNKHY